MVAVSFVFAPRPAEYKDDAACLRKLMEINWDGTEITCPACRIDRAKAHPMRKRPASAWAHQLRKLMRQADIELGGGWSKLTKRR